MMFNKTKLLAVEPARSDAATVPCSVISNANTVAVKERGISLLRKHKTRIAFASLFAFLGIGWVLAPTFGLIDCGSTGMSAGLNYSACTQNHFFLGHGFDTARDISRLVTYVTFVICFFVPRTKAVSVKRAIAEIAGLLCIPILVHLAGTYVINNFISCGCGSL